MTQVIIQAAEGSVIYKDTFVTVCQASSPLSKGHTIVFWNEQVEDLHCMSREDFDYLMNIVDSTRNALLKVLHLEKVYLLYLDELKQVHWHLVPRYDEKGFNILLHSPQEIKEFPLVERLKEEFKLI